jgi:hypothetical protein
MSRRFHDAFLEQGRYLRIWSPTTLYTYAQGLRALDLERPDLDAWVVGLRARGLTPDGIAFSVSITMNGRTRAIGSADARRPPSSTEQSPHEWVVARLQKTMLHEHWRIAFRRQYFTGRRALQGRRHHPCADGGLRPLLLQLHRFCVVAQAR